MIFRAIHLIIVSHGKIILPIHPLPAGEIREVNCFIAKFDTRNELQS